MSAFIDPLLHSLPPRWGVFIGPTYLLETPAPRVITCASGEGREFVEVAAHFSQQGRIVLGGAEALLALLRV